MSNRSEKIEFYVTPEQKQTIKQLADDDDMTLSSYCHAVLKRHLHAEAYDKKAREHDVERRLEELIAQARDEIETATTNIEAVQELTAQHSIAIWELLKSGYGGAQRTEAMTTASQRLRASQGQLSLDPDQLIDDTQEPTSQSNAEPSTPADTATPDDSSTDKEDSDDRSWDFS